jgi:hypothetical protein
MVASVEKHETKNLDHRNFACFEIFYSRNRGSRNALLAASQLPRVMFIDHTIGIFHANAVRFDDPVKPDVTIAMVARK